jgi:hypothetical protein
VSADITTAITHGKCWHVTFSSSKEKHVKRASKRLRLGLTIEDINQLATELNPWAGTDEPVSFRWRWKPNGTRRRTVRYGLQRKALQYLIADVVSAVTPELAHRYDLRGRGRNQAARAIVEQINQGARHVMIGDVSNCYPSINAQALEGLLPLPRRVTRSVVCPQLNVEGPIRRRRHIPQYGIRSSDRVVTTGDQRLVSGLAQGSAASPPVERYLSASAVSAVNQTDVLITFVDDNAVPTAGSEEARSAENSLRAYFRTHPAGPLELRTEVHAIRHGFEFLGYRFRAIGAGEQRWCFVDLRARTLRSFHEQLCEAAELDYENGDFDFPRLERKCDVLVSTHSEISWGRYIKLVLDGFGTS